MLKQIFLGITSVVFLGLAAVLLCFCAGFGIPLVGFIAYRLIQGNENFLSLFLSSLGVASIFLLARLSFYVFEKACDAT